MVDRLIENIFRTVSLRHFARLNVVLCSELLQILSDEFFLLEFDAVRSIYSQIFHIISSDSEKFFSLAILQELSRPT